MLVPPDAVKEARGVETEAAARGEMCRGGVLRAVAGDEGAASDGGVTARGTIVFSDAVALPFASAGGGESVAAAAVEAPALDMSRTTTKSRTPESRPN
jgi:hypothetical protein